MSKDRYKIESNYENGLGRSDIVIKDSKRRKAAVLEIKQTKNRGDLEALCDEALKQIKRERYSDKIKNDGYREVIEYGVTFYKKDCLVKSKFP